MSEQVLPVAAEFAEEYCGEDRRAAERFRAPEEMTCHVVVTEGKTAWRAQVRDVATLGIGLLIPQRVEPGTLLSIDLGSLTHEPARTLLARVVHTTAYPGRGWVVGCALTSELTDAELQAFQAARVRPPGTDCRRWVRFPCSVETVCHAFDTAPVTQAPARIVDISPGGLGLLTVCEFEPGTVLTVELPDGLELPPRKAVRVVHVKERGNGDWFLGCEFADTLDQGMLRALRGAAHPSGD